MVFKYLSMVEKWFGQGNAATFNAVGTAVDLNNVYAFGTTAHIYSSAHYAGKFALADTTFKGITS